MPSFCVLSRERFLEWLAGSFVPRDARSRLSGVPRTGSGEVVLGWKDEPASCRLATAPVIIVPSRLMSEFLAFTSTYVTTFQPLSAFFRIISRELLEELYEDERERARDLPEEFVAIAIGEAYVQVGGSRSLKDISVQAGLATISSAIIAGIARGYKRQNIQNSISDWGASREILLSEQAKFPAEAVLGFWAPILDVLFEGRKQAANYGPYQSAVSFVRSQLVRGFDGDSTAWPEFARNLPDSIRVLGEQKNLSREDQVKIIDSVAERLIAADDIEQLLREIIAGYLVARISGGAIEYISLCNPFLARLPRAVLWFSFFVACWPKGNVLSAGDGLGRRVARNLFIWNGLFSPPTADIGVRELERQATERTLSRNIRTDQKAVVSVELLPGVVARYRTRHDVAEQPRAPEIDTAIDDRSLRDVRASLTSALRTIDTLQARRTRSDVDNHRRDRSSKR
jgi:hypothetical protein